METRPSGQTSSSSAMDKTRSASKTTRPAKDTKSADYKEGTPSACKMMFNKISDSIFNQRDTLLVINQNSISYANYGCSYDIIAKYPYGDVAGLRRPDFKVPSYSHTEFHDKEGTTIIKSPPTDTVGPSICTLITQYGIGRNYEDNNIAQRIAKYCRDTTISDRLAADTKDNRILYFNKAIYNLSNQLASEKFSHLKKVILPVGIGRSGKVDMIWLCKYFSIIEVFARHLQNQGKQVILLMKNRCDNLDETYLPRSDYAGFCYRKLKKLSVLKADKFLLDIPSPAYSHSEKEDDVPDTQTYYCDL